MTKRKQARAKARRSLGPGYQRRLLAAFSVLVDGEGLLKDYGCRDHELQGVCNALRQLREDGEIDF